MTLTVGVFGLSGPVLIARSRRLFEQHGVEVAFDQVTSSDQQFQDLASGRYQLVVTAFDNIVSYASNAGNAVGRRLDVIAPAAFDAGMNLSLIGNGVGSIEELRGRTLAVDAEHTGFAFVLYELLAGAGLRRGVDYELVRHGGVFHRFQRILAGESAGTLLSNGFEALAELAGLSVLGTSDDVVRPYLGAVLGAERTWYLDHEDEGVAFMRAYEEALAIALDPAHHGEVVEAIATARGVSTEQAEAIWAGERGPRGLLPTTAIDVEGARGVIALRLANDGFESAEDLDADAMIDRLTLGAGD